MFFVYLKKPNFKQRYTYINIPRFTYFVHFLGVFFGHNCGCVKLSSYNSYYFFLDFSFFPRTSFEELYSRIFSFEENGVDTECWFPESKIYRNLVLIFMMLTLFIRMPSGCHSCGSNEVKWLLFHSTFYLTCTSCLKIWNLNKRFSCIIIPPFGFVTSLPSM